MTTVVDRERGGATSVQMALLWTGILALVLASVQTALFFYAGQVALTAAEEGLRSGRYYKAEPADEGDRRERERREPAGALLRRAARVTSPLSPAEQLQPSSWLASQQSGFMLGSQQTACASGAQQELLLVASVVVSSAMRIAP